ncbi:hypothetical protein DUI87_30634 [Hirundo rustica rustica]|uniref:ribonuclease H n=1 Tax=Hirundo rustica rustica TaxID=333673 RepID=A0A3M0JDV1_HIRRU|nr:hypothetical protein DUI87_30634 [Hirundo rustica rustica]
MRRGLTELIEQPTSDSGGLLKECLSEFNTPILPVQKHDGSYRIVQDLMAVNKITEDLYPVVANPYTLLTCLTPELSWFTVLDLKDAFFSLPIHKDSQKIFAFEWENPQMEHKSQLTWSVLPQGSKNSPTLFREQLAKDLESWEAPPEEGKLLQYVDDILIATRTKEACVAWTVSLLNFLGLQGYRVSKKKAQVVKQKVIYLGYENSAGQQTLGQDRKEAICQTPRPQMVKELRTFLGMTGWCRLWIHSYGLLVKPLYALITNGNRNLQWTKEATQAFHQLKNALMSAPALGLPNVMSAGLEVKGGHWLSPQRFLKYQAIMVEQDDVEILVTNIINPASFLSGNQGEPVHHDCLETIEASYSSCPDLKDAPLDDAETWFTDGSSYVINGKRHAGYAVTTCREVIEYGPLPTDTSAQKAEIISLTRALEITKGKKVNIYTDSRYAFGVVHAHGAIWKERGLLNSQGKNIRHSQEILRLLEAVQLPEQVAIMHIKAHQKVSSKLEEGNELADREAKEAAKGEITIKGALIPDGQVSLEVREEHQKTHWGIEALYNYLIEKITARNLYSTVIQIEEYTQAVKFLYEKLTEGDNIKWTKEDDDKLEKLKLKLASIPALSLPSLEKPFHLYVNVEKGVAHGVLVQEWGGVKRPVAYLSKMLDPVSHGWPVCIQAIAATAILIEESRKLTFGGKLIVCTPHAVRNVLNQKAEKCLTDSRMLKYEAILIDSDDLTLEVLLTTEAVIRTKEREWIDASRLKGPVEELKEWTITSEPGAADSRLEEEEKMASPTKDSSVSCDQMTDKTSKAYRM